VSGPPEGYREPLALITYCVYCGESIEYSDEAAVLRNGEMLAHKNCVWNWEEEE
jgi:hypothetical protein